MRTVIFKGKEVTITKRLFQFVSATVQLKCGDKEELGFTENVYQYCLWKQSMKRRGLLFPNSPEPVVLEIVKVHNDWDSLQKDKNMHIRSRAVKYTSGITRKEYFRVSGLLFVKGSKSIVLPSMNLYRRYVGLVSSLMKGTCKNKEMQEDFDMGGLTFSVLEKNVPEHLLLLKAREYSKATVENTY